MSKAIITLSIALIFAATASASSLDFTIVGAEGGTAISENQVQFIAGIGGTFEFGVWVDPSPGEYFKGLSLFLTDTAYDEHPQGRNAIYLSSRNLHGIDWAYGPYVTDPTTSDQTLWGCKGCMDRFLIPNTSDLGATTNNPAYGDIAGELMTLELYIPDNLGEGEFTITPAGSTYVKNDNSAGDFDHYDELTVRIIPEPVTLSLLALCGAILIRRR